MKTIDSLAAVDYLRWLPGTVLEISRKCGRGEVAVRSAMRRLMAQAYVERKYVKGRTCEYAPTQIGGNVAAGLPELDLANLRERKSPNSRRNAAWRARLREEEAWMEAIGREMQAVWAFSAPRPDALITLASMRGIDPCAS